MSFILDALKKSESERQRADTPALYEMKMAPARPAVATWLIALAVLLGINVVVLAVVLLRGTHSAAPQPEGAAAPAPTASAQAMAPPAAQAPPVAAPALAAPAPLPQSTPGAVANSNPPADDDAPAVDPGRVMAGAAPAEADVPTYEQAASAPGADLPQLKLDLHVYSNSPSGRFVFLNMLNLKEGQTSPAGVRVEAITPDGAILSWHGAKFFLHSQ